MKQSILLLIMLILQFEGFGQNVVLESGNHKGWGSAMSLNVRTNEQSIKFERSSDYSARKILPAYFQLTVKAPQPAQWVITASLSDVYSASNVPSNKLENLVQLRTPGGQTFILTNRPQIILQSNSNIKVDEFSLDLLIDPPFNMSEGVMPGMVNFRLELL